MLSNSSSTSKNNKNVVFVKDLLLVQIKSLNDQVNLAWLLVTKSEIRKNHISTFYSSIELEHEVSNQLFVTC